MATAITIAVVIAVAVLARRGWRALRRG